MARSAPILGGGTVTLDAAAFEADFNMPLVHESVRADLNARRRGTASTKTRGEVSGGGSKPWRQKGTGRARAGSSRSPVWTGGGTVFGPQPRSYTFKVNRKARRAALRGALSMHAERETLAVFDASVFDEPATKRAAALLSVWGAAAPVLVLLAEAEAAAGKSFRNVKRVDAMPVADAGVADVVGAASLLVSEAALTELVARATGTAPATPAEEGGRKAARSSSRTTRAQADQARQDAARPASSSGRRATRPERGAGRPAEETS
jgi:large subunit ribosomal protein L4